MKNSFAYEREGENKKMSNKICWGIFMTKYRVYRPHTNMWDGFLFEK